MATKTAAKTENKKLRINPIIGFLMIPLAFLVDGAQLVALFFAGIPDNLWEAVQALFGQYDGVYMGIGLSWYVGFFAVTAFFLWFSLMKVPFGGSGIMRAICLIAIAFELVPVVGVFPFLLPVVAWTIISTTSEDLGFKIGLLDIATLVVPGGQAVAAARFASRTAAVAEKTQQTAAVAKQATAGRAALTAKNKAAQEAAQDFGPGTQQKRRPVDPNAPYRRIQPREQSSRFADPYVPQSNDRDVEEEEKWAA